MRTAGYQVSRRLRLRIEHLFGEGKECHGLDRARYRGLGKFDGQVQLTAAVMNLKRLAYWRGRRATAGSMTASAALKMLRTGLQEIVTLLLRIRPANAAKCLWWPLASSELRA